MYSLPEGDIAESVMPARQPCFGCEALRKKSLLL